VAQGDLKIRKITLEQWRGEGGGDEREGRRLGKITRCLHQSQ
jgi:hypothetical protein